jgi:cytochrome b subunit of formate dehydrogenase
MALTGLVLWYPALATNRFPVWIVRVAEVIHFYEAILAVSAIFIWHFFFVIFLPAVYPMSTTWLDGRIPAREWKEFHAGEYAEKGDREILDPGEDDPSPPGGA